jgi:hypothetical protein
MVLHIGCLPSCLNFAFCHCISVFAMTRAMKPFDIPTTAGPIHVMARDLEHAQAQAAELVGPRYRVGRSTQQKGDMWHD